MKFNQTNVLRATCAAALLALGGSAFAVDFSANVELDTTYLKDTPKTGLTQSGRVELNVSNKAGKDMFVAGNASFLAKKDGGVATDDMWVQVGNSTGDLKLGRFEGADLFPLPGDTVVNEVLGVYKTNLLRGRTGSNHFHAAGTVNLGSGLSVELGLIETKAASSIDANGDDVLVRKGVRPVISYANGPLSLRAGLESLKVNAGSSIVNGKVNGFGATAAYDFGGFKLTGNVASGKAKDSLGTAKLSAFALVATVGPANVGFITGKDGDDKSTTLYASYTLPLFDIKGASITPAVSWSKASFVGGRKDTAAAARVRVNYTF
jgi:Porin-like glycoporin RafY